jgi:hypothetical protein
LQQQNLLVIYSDDFTKSIFDAKVPVMTGLPELTDEQRRAALVKAAEARRARAEIKELLKMGSLTFPGLLERADNDPVIAKMKVLSALESLPKLGKVKARRTMEEIGISESRRLKGLGSQQRSDLLSRFS